MGQGERKGGGQGKREKREARKSAPDRCCRGRGRAGTEAEVAAEVERMERSGARHSLDLETALKFGTAIAAGDRRRDTGVRRRVVTQTTKRHRWPAGRRMRAERQGRWAGWSHGLLMQGSFEPQRLTLGAAETEAEVGAAEG